MECRLIGTATGGGAYACGPEAMVVMLGWGWNTGPGPLADNGVRGCSPRGVTGPRWN